MDSSILKDLFISSFRAVGRGKQEKKEGFVKDSDEVFMGGFWSGLSCGVRLANGFLFFPKA